MSIGFKYAGKHLPATIKQDSELIDTISPEQRKAITDKLLQQEGMVKAITLLNEYFSSSYLPLLQGSKRDDMYIEKLRKVKERYFEPI